MLHIPLIFTTYVRNLNWHILGAFASMNNSLRNLQPVNWSSRHYHALFRKPNVLLVLGLCHKTNKCSPRCYTVLINISLMLFIHLRQGLPHSFPLPSFVLRVGCLANINLSDLFIESPLVTICTASLTLHNSTFCPHSVFMCFVWIWEQTAIISLYSIDWLVFITQTEFVYCAVRTGFACTILVNFYVQGYYWFLTDFVCSSTSRILQWTPPNSQFNVPLLPATCVIPIEIFRFREEISSQRTF
jgi:hypothetical protein